MRADETEKKFTLKDLYRHLGDTMAELRSGKIEVDRANAISNVAQTMINAGKLEVSFINAAGGQGTGFIDEKQAAAAAPSRPRLVNKSTW